MTLDKILTCLETTDYSTFQRQALQEAVKQQQEITPALLTIIERAANDPQWLNENMDYMGFTYALYLLAQFKEKRAYPLIVKYFSQLGTDDNCLDATGDIVTEDLASILASVCGNDLGLIKEIIENPEINKYVRTAALESLVILYKFDLLTRAELISYFKCLLESRLDKQEKYMRASLACCCLDIHPDELYDELIDCFDQGYIDLDVVGKKNIVVYKQKDKEQVIAKLKTNKRLQLIDDVIAEMEWWACFHPSPPSTPSKTILSNNLDYHGSTNFHPGETKIGRNDPCPCGSGKKYKKCCLH
jgi:hypothetical protein